MKILVVAAALLAFIGSGCKKHCDEAWQRNYDLCVKQCAEYGAAFAGLTPITGFCTGECWCRKGAEQGGGSEPIRIW
jgi:hypothetical protein